MSQFMGWTARVNECLTNKELEAVRLSAQRGKPPGDEAWMEAIARRLSLESTMRPEADHEFVSQRSQWTTQTKRPNALNTLRRSRPDRQWMLTVQRLQPEGKQAMDATAFLNGYGIKGSAEFRSDG